MRVLPGGQRLSVELKLKGIAAIGEIAEQIMQIRMGHRLARFVRDEVLFRDISDVIAFIVLGEQVIERLVFGWAAVLGNVLVPLIRVREHCINIEHNTAKRVLAVAQHLSKVVFRRRFQHRIASPCVRKYSRSGLLVHWTGDSEGKQSVDLFLTVLQIVAPVGLLGAIGFVWVRTGHEYRMEFITRLSMTLSVPALIFTALMKTKIDPSALTNLMLAAIFAYLALSAIFWLLLRLGRLSQRTYLAPMIFGNTGNVGLPLALFAFGEAGFAYAVVVFAVMAIFSFTAGVWLVSGGGSPLRALKEPVTWGTLLGGLFLWQGWQTPDWLTNSLSLLGQIAIPMMLITLGVAVARLNAGHLGKAFAMSLLRVAVCMAVGVGIGLWLKLEPVAFAILVLQISTPVAVTSYMLAEKYGADSDAVAGMVIASTLLAVVSLPLTLAFLI